MNFRGPVGREDLHRKIYEAILSALEPNTTKPKILYVCGQPGTGKTLTVKHVIKSLKEDNVQFAFAELNALGLPTSDHIFIEACRQIMTGKETPKSIIAAHKAFELNLKRAKKPVIVLIDEFDNIDCKCSRRLVKLYDLFEWPSKYSGKFVLILIANTISIAPPLAARCGSRLGNNQIIFPAYSWETLEMIVNDTLPIKIKRKMESKVIEICARRAAARKGDARLCLELIQSLIESEIWTFKDAHNRMSYMFNFVATSPIQRMHLSCQILVMCILACIEAESAACYASVALDKYKSQIGGEDGFATEELFHSDLDQLAGADIVACSSHLRLEHVGSRLNTSSRSARSCQNSSLRLFRSHPDVAMPWGQVRISVISTISDLMEGLRDVVTATPLGAELRELYSGGA